MVFDNSSLEKGKKPSLKLYVTPYTLWYDLDLKFLSTPRSDAKVRYLCLPKTPYKKNYFSWALVYSCLDLRVWVDQ